MSGEPLPAPELLDGQSVKYYEAKFKDLEYWYPYLREISARESMCNGLLCNPEHWTGCVFVHAEPGFVVKLFPQIWDPKLAQDAEVDSYKLITHLNLEGGYYMPSLLHSGELEFANSSEKLRYVVLSLVKGKSLSKLIHQLQDGVFYELVANLSLIISEIHAKTLTNDETKIHKFNEYVEARIQKAEEQHRKWGHLPEHLLSQIPNFLSSIRDRLLSSESVHLIHCDFNGDNILMKETDKFEWELSGVIDWADAFYGNRARESRLTSEGKQKFLQAFLDEYDKKFQRTAEFPRLLTAWLLMFEWDLFDQSDLGLLKWRPEITECCNWEEVASILFQIEP